MVHPFFNGAPGMGSRQEHDELGGKIDEVHESIKGLSGVVEQNMKAIIEQDEVGEHRRREGMT